MPLDEEALCNGLVFEIYQALRLCRHEGEELTGAHLLRYRRLPEREKAYFAALTKPVYDPDEATRIGELTRGADGRPVMSYTPPYPEPCSCSAKLLADYMHNAVRCSRCLHTWRIVDQCKRVADGFTHRQSLTYPLADSVDRKDMGYAIERVLPGGRGAEAVSDPAIIAVVPSELLGLALASSREELEREMRALNPSSWQDDGTSSCQLAHGGIHAFAGVHREPGTSNVWADRPQPLTLAQLGEVLAPYPEERGYRRARAALPVSPLVPMKFEEQCPACNGFGRCSLSKGHAAPCDHPKGPVEYVARRLSQRDGETSSCPVDGDRVQPDSSAFARARVRQKGT